MTGHKTGDGILIAELGEWPQLLCSGSRGAVAIARTTRFAWELADSPNCKWIRRPH